MGGFRPLFQRRVRETPHRYLMSRRPARGMVCTWVSTIEPGDLVTMA
jgi:hypothetical protein